MSPAVPPQPCLPHDTPVLGERSYNGRNEAMAWPDHSRIQRPLGRDLCDSTCEIGCALETALVLRHSLSWSVGLLPA